MDVYHGIEYSWHIFMFSGVRVKVHWWRPRRQRVYPFASVSLRVIATPDCASTFGHDLIVSAAVYIVCTCTRTHSYAHHAHIDTSVLYARWIPCVHVDRYAYGLWTYVRVSAYEERKSVKGGEERGTKCTLETVETPWILETTRISLAQLMNIDVPFSTDRPHLYHSFLFENRSSSLLSFWIERSSSYAAIFRWYKTMRLVIDFILRYTYTEGFLLKYLKI